MGGAVYVLGREPLVPDRMVLALEICAVDLERRAIRYTDGRTDDLTEQEHGLLRYLAARPGRTVPREELLERVWGYSTRAVTRAIDVAVRRLRHKIEADPSAPRHVVTVRGAGYRFEPDPDSLDHPDAPDPREPQGQPHAPAQAPAQAPPQAPTVTHAADPALSPLPHERSAFVGRVAEVAQVLDAVARGARLITVSGGPGAGKSRLAVRIGNQLRADGRDVAWVPLALPGLPPVHGAPELTRRVAAALGVQLDPRRDDAGAVVQLGLALQTRGPLVLIVDDADPVVGPLARAAAAWLEGAGELCVVVTSRERLQLRGEVAVTLGGLDPDDAVSLLLGRARAIAPTWGADPGDAPVVAAIARALDDNPLAIELAAARAEVMPPAALLAGLDERLQLLSVADREADPRQTSLYRAIDWSWSLLAPAERALLAQCAVFAGGFSLAAADDVAHSAVAATDPEGTDADDVWLLDRVQALCARSLITAAPTAGQVRFRIPESIRAFAERKAVALGLWAQARARHRDRFRAEAQRIGAQPGWGVAQLRAIAADLANYQAARRASLDDGDVDGAAVIGLVIDVAYETAGPADERERSLTELIVRFDPPSPALEARLRLARARTWALSYSGEPAQWQAELAAAAALAERNGDPALRREVLLATGELAYFSSGDLAGARDAATDGASGARDAGDRRHEARALVLLALLDVGDPVAQTVHLDRLAALVRDVDPVVEVHALHLRGLNASALGDVARAVELLERGVAAALGVGDLRRAAVVEASLGAALSRAGRIAEAKERFARAAARARAIGVGAAIDLANAATMALLLGERDEAERIADEALDEARRSGGPSASWPALGVRGVARLIAGDASGGLAALGSAIALVSATSRSVSHGHYAAWAAIAAAELGRPDEAGSWLTVAEDHLGDAGAGLIAAARGAQLAGADRAAEAEAELSRAEGLADRRPALLALIEFVLPAEVHLAIGHVRRRARSG